MLHNDDINGMDHVVGALRKVFNYNLMKAIGLMLQAHQTGRSIVWTGTLELAELKADQLRSCGADPNMRERGAVPARRYGRAAAERIDRPSATVAGKFYFVKTNIVRSVAKTKLSRY